MRHPKTAASFGTETRLEGMAETRGFQSLGVWVQGWCLALCFAARPSADIG